MIRELVSDIHGKEIFIIIIKVLLCILLVGFIGYNREKKGMVVGIRTHVLVGLAGLLIQITSLEYYKVNGGNNDIFRLAGQYISGIGFLGAGTILKDKRSVKGLTTAASICLAACIGLAIGSGIYIASIIITLVAYIFLTDLFRLKKIIALKKDLCIFLEIEIIGVLPSSMEKINDIVRACGADIMAIEMGKNCDERSKVIFKLSIDDELDINDILSEIICIEGVIKADIVKRA